MPVALAVLAGIGAQWLSISIMRGAISVSAVLTRFPSVRTSDLPKRSALGIEAPVPFVLESQWQSLVPLFFALAGLLGFAVGTVSRVSPQILTRARQQEMPSVDQRTDKS